MKLSWLLANLIQFEIALDILQSKADNSAAVCFMCFRVAHITVVNVKYFKNFVSVRAIQIVCTLKKAFSAFLPLRTHKIINFDKFKYF